MKGITEFMMYYHTSLRNIAMFTLITLSIMMRGETGGTPLFTILGLITSGIALSINIHLLMDYEDYQKKNTEKGIGQWINLARVTILLEVGIMAIIIYRLSNMDLKDDIRRFLAA